MRGGFVTARLWGGARALAVAVVAAALVMPIGLTGSAAAPDEQGAGLPKLVPVELLGGASFGEALKRAASARAHRAAKLERRRAQARRRRAARRAARRAVHPVRASVDYGESGARFGAGRPGHVHSGQDVFAPAGTPLVAVRDAVVIGSGSDGGRGNYVELFSAEAGETYAYFHMQSSASVRVGERVSAGQVVGRLGCSGSCWGDHLHFEVHRGRGVGGEAVDPLPRLLRWRRAGT